MLSFGSKFVYSIIEKFVVNVTFNNNFSIIIMHRVQVSQNNLYETDYTNYNFSQL